MFKLPFGRNKQQNQDIPQEIQNYYQAEKREKVGIAGLLALGTLLVTIVVAMGLFFGGRWVYRTVFEDDQSTTQQTAENEGQNEEERAPAEEEEPTDTEVIPDPAPAPAPAPQPQTPPRQVSGTPNSDLPNTGPADTAALVIGAIILGSAVYYYAAKPSATTR